MEFKIGDMVKWRSQAGGRWTEKQGRVVYRLMKHENPLRVWELRFFNHRRLFDGLRPPNTTGSGIAYLISVSSDDDRVPKLYMPRPASLELLVPAVEPPMAARWVRKLVPLEGALELEPSIEDYERIIIKWATERGLLAGTTPTKQTLKLMEEAGELCKAMMLEDIKMAKLELGDMMVVMVNICGKLGITLNDCIATAYHKIKDRKGRMLNGSFVKDE